MNDEEILLRISNAEMMGRIAERERIIKLLEAECDDGWPTGVKHLETNLNYLIALIKGENN